MTKNLLLCTSCEANAASWTYSRDLSFKQRVGVRPIRSSLYQCTRPAVNTLRPQSLTSSLKNRVSALGGNPHIASSPAAVFEKKKKEQQKVCCVAPLTLSFLKNDCVSHFLENA